MLDPDSTPGIASLTSLEELTVHVHHQRRVQLHVTALTRLTRLEGQSCTVTSRPGQPTLSALTALNRLQHLDLDRCVMVPRPYGCPMRAQSCMCLCLQLALQGASAVTPHPNTLPLPIQNNS